MHILVTDENRAKYIRLTHRVKAMARNKREVSEELHNMYYIILVGEDNDDYTLECCRRFFETLYRYGDFADYVVGVMDKFLEQLQNEEINYQIEVPTPEMMRINYVNLYSGTRFVPPS